MQTQSFENSQHFQGKHILAWLILNFLMNVIAKKKQLLWIFMDANKLSNIGLN